MRRGIAACAFKAALVALALFGSLRVFAAQSHGHGALVDQGASSPYAALAPFRCQGAGLNCATAIAPAWATDGSLWVVWVADGTVAVARSRDVGATWSEPVVVARHGERLDIGPDAMPQIVVDAKGRITVIYSVFRDEQWNAEVLVASSDDGRRFSSPRSIGANPASQRFPAVVSAPDGALFVAWIDKRLVAAAAKQGKRVQGASVAYAWSQDGGRSFTVPAIAYAESCECCRIGVALPAADRPMLAFRGVFGQKVRDHALVAFTDRSTPGAMRRIADDNWVTDACPHHGPSLAVDRLGTVHVAWFTQGRTRSGTFYARSTDQGQTFSAPMQIGRADHRPGRPHLLADGATVWMTWKEFDGETATVHRRISIDGGVHWGDVAEVARTRGYSHHPVLTRNNGRTYLSWLTHDEGYRVLALQ